ncbi:MAG: hypothetical protein DMD36_08235 [Gemmatimonadetes bacterium]|nr:MAG: hypothetical protein DMD36_08235 [Gemmatimonadota bacterium]
MTPLLRRIAIHTGVMAHPNERSVHLIPAPYLGGVAMFGGLAGALYATRFTPLKVAWSGSTLLPGVIVAAAVMTAVGTLDDAYATAIGAVLGFSLGTRASAWLGDLLTSLW